MQQHDYYSILTANIPPKEALEKISRVNEWWSTQVEGSFSRPGDIFTVRFQNGDWYQIKIDALIPGQKLVWNVIDAEQTWHEESKEWAGTKILWEISPERDGSNVRLTHLGLIPEFECYGKCSRSWDWLMQKSITGLLTEGKGLPVS
jgi:hypothetical protein